MFDKSGRGMEETPSCSEISDLNILNNTTCYIVTTKTELDGWSWSTVHRLRARITHALGCGEVRASHAAYAAVRRQVTLPLTGLGVVGGKSHCSCRRSIRHVSDKNELMGDSSNP